jgi:hypothetical protein
MYINELNSIENKNTRALNFRSTIRKIKKAFSLFLGITMRLILHRGFVQRLVFPCAVGLTVRNYSEIY